jgi:hypothetical protein
MLSPDFPLGAVRPDSRHPMGAARIVRKEAFAWPGAYPLALVMTDGALLCPHCVHAEFHLIADAYRSGDTRSGWAPYALAILDDPEPEVPALCDHCGNLIGEPRP